MKKIAVVASAVLMLMGKRNAKNERAIMLNKAKTLKGYKLDIRHAGRESMMALIVVVCLGLASATGWAAPTEQKKMTDQQINNAVEHALLTDSALPNNQIDARTSEGIVTLTGTADNFMAKERAAKLAQTLRGVRGVVNTINLQIAPVPDDELRKNVESALLYDAATDSYELKTEAKDGAVTLSGTVQSYREKQLAVHVAKGVKGVKEVKDSITVKTKSDRPDSEIAAEVKRIITIDAWLAPNFITTEVKDGIVTLTGEVGSSAQHGRASLLAWTAGVKSVNTEGLRIEPWAGASGQRKDTIAIKGDPQTKQAVQDALVHDPRVFSFNPSVEVENGVVTLTGVVDNLKAKRAAEQDATNTVGVWRVKNLLKVRPAKPLADDKIAQNVNSAFLRDPIVDSYQIDAKAKHGVVTLTGTVDSYYKKAQADNIASLANGVVNVKNNLTVSYPAPLYYDIGYDPYWAHTPFYVYRDTYRPPYDFTWPYTSDAEVKDDIEKELFWSPFVDPDQIVVKVENGVATLTGMVYSWSEYRAATENAYEGGASSVKNELKIKKEP
jgi:osmotically-inducible protein OsmY